MRLNLSLGALAVLQLISSLFVQLAVLRIVGAGAQTDAFVAAQAVPLVLFSILSVAFQSVWQPRFSVLADDKLAWRESLGQAQAQVLLTFGAVATLLCLTAPNWTQLLFPGFNHQTTGLSASMALPLFTAAALNCHSAVLTTALRTCNKFIRAEAISLGGSVFAIGLLLIVVPHGGVQAAAWVTCARAILVFGFLYVQTNRPPILFNKAWGNSKVWGQIRPLIAGATLYKTAPLFDRYWSSQASTGSVTILSLAQTGMGAIGMVLERSICVPVAPQLARLVERKDWLGLRSAYRKCVLQISLATLLVAVVFAALYPVWDYFLEPLLNLPAPLAREMWVICLWLLGYLHVAASGTIAVAAFYAMGDTRTPVKVGVTGFLFGVVFKALGFLLMGISGLAAATSVYYLCNMVAMCFLLEKKINARLS